MTDKFGVMCRFCLQSGKDKSLYSIFGKYAKHRITAMINFVYGIQIENLNRVTNICEECLVKLDITHGIVEEVRDNDIKLKNMLRDRKLLVEGTDDSDEENNVLLDKSFKCNICNQDVQSGHLELHKNLLPYICAECDIKIYEIADLNEHLSAHHVNSLEVMLTEENNEFDDSILNYVDVIEEIHEQERVELEKHLKCYICNTIIENNLNEHLSEHQSVSLECNHCDDTHFESPRELNEHLVFHDEECPFKCKHCYKRFMDSESVEAHETTHQITNPVIKLNISRRKVKRRSSNERSTDENSCKKKNQCSFCGRQFQTYSVLRTHENSVHTLCRKYSCTMCDKVYGTSSSLKSHIMSHTGEKPFECQFCGKRFRIKNYWKDHVKLHTGEKPYQCKYCNRNFRTHQWFIRHRKGPGCVPSKPKKSSYECHVCNQTSSNLIGHKDHMEEMHQGYPHMFECKKCDLNFCTLPEYRKHRKRDYAISKNAHVIRNKRHQCEICDKLFSTNQALVTHKVIHTGLKPFTCEKCGKSFANVANLRRHLLLHADKKYKCEFCEKCFHQPMVLKVHLRIHTGEKPYACKFCDLRFGDYSSLNKHRKKIHDNKIANQHKLLIQNVLN